MIRPDALPSSSPAVPAPTAPSAPSLGVPIEPRRLLGALLRARRRLGCSVLAAALVGALAGKFVVPKSYLASATLLWQPPTAGHADATREVATVAQSVKVPTNLVAVRERLGLTISIDKLAQQLEVTLGDNSHLLIISAHTPDRDASVLLTQTAVNVFLDAQRRQAQGKLEESVSALRQSLAQADTAQAQARSRYDAFRTEHHVEDFSIDVLTAIQDAARLRVSASEAEVDLRGLEARLSSLRGAHATAASQVVLSRNETNDDQARLGRLDSELAGLRARFTDDHPRVQAAAAEVEALRGRLDSASPTVVGQVVGRSPLHYALTMQVEESTALRRAVAERARALTDLRRAAEERAGHLTHVQGEAARLLSDVQANEGHVASLFQQLASAEDDVRKASSGFQVVSSPLRPERSEKGMGRVVAIVLPLLVLVVGMLVVLVRELRTGMVRSASEVAHWLRGPVVWASSWPAAGSPTTLARELSDAIEGPPRVIGVLGLGGSPSQALVELAVARLKLRGSPVSVWDARDACILGEDALPEACEDRAVGEWLQGMTQKGRVVLVTGLDGAPLEALRALSRWLDSLLVVVGSGSTGAFELRALGQALPRLTGRLGAVVVNAPDGLGAREVRGATWLPPAAVDAPSPADRRSVAQRLQRRTARSRSRRS